MSDSFKAQDDMFGGSDNSLYQCGGYNDTNIDQKEARILELEALVFNKPLTKFMDNLDASKLGEITYKADMELCGDYIDKGLILRRMMEANGYLIIKQVD